MNSNTKIKICGMKSPGNIQELLGFQLDYMGLIFYNKSERFVNFSLAKEIRNAFQDKKTQKVGVFVNATADEIQCIKDVFQLDLLQLHGNETPGACQLIKNDIKLPVIKSFAVDSNFDFSSILAYEGSCDYFLFDTKGDLPGGNGYRFDWDLLQNYKGNTPFFLSGGISLEHVQDLKQFQHPMLYTIDVNSGFEWIPGIKKVEDVGSFIETLKNSSARMRTVN